MNRAQKLITRRALTFAFTATVMISAHHTTGDPRTVTFDRPGPCSTCGHARPVTITCQDLTWTIWDAGTVRDVANRVCPPNTPYTWKAEDVR
jgi:hypothetical protein